MRRAMYAAAPCGLAMLLSGCGALGLSFDPAATPVEDPAETRVITQQEIEESGARDAWEVLRRMGTNMSFRETRTGDAARVSRRGRSSIMLRDDPLLVVDGHRLEDVRVLQQIPAHTISTIELLSATLGTARYGTNAGNGVIVVTSRFQ